MYVVVDFKRETLETRRRFGSEFDCHGLGTKPSF